MLGLRVFSLRLRTYILLREIQKKMDQIATALAALQADINTLIGLGVNAGGLTAAQVAADLATITTIDNAVKAAITAATPPTTGS